VSPHCVRQFADFLHDWRGRVDFGEAARFAALQIIDTIESQQPMQLHYLLA
jgi:hypothetical protein